MNLTDYLINVTNYLVGFYCLASKILYGFFSVEKFLSDSNLDIILYFAVVNFKRESQLFVS